MDRETTQRLLRESIIFLCKTYLGVEVAAGFEIDSIICVSRRHSDIGKAGYEDPRPVVFKFHELITEDTLLNMEDGQIHRSSMGDNNWQAKNLLQECGSLPVTLSQPKKRKVEDLLSGDRFMDSEKKTGPIGKTGQLTVNGIVLDSEIIKNEAAWSQSSDSVDPISLQITPAKNYTAKSKADGQNTDNTLSRSVLVSNSNNCLTSIIPSIVNGSKDPSNQVGVNGTGDSYGGGSLQEHKFVLNNSRSITSKSRSASDGGNVLDQKLAEQGNLSTSSANPGDENNASDPSSSMEQSVPRSCDVCQQMFADFPTFNVHCTSVHGRFACPFCELSFPCETARERHLFEHTGEPVDEAGDDVTSPASADIGTNDSTGPSFGNVGFDGQSAKSSSAIDLSSDNEDEMTGANGSFFESHLLSRRGTISTHALRAIASLDPSRPFVCDVCRAQFEDSSELCDHCANVHRRVPCPFCGRSFSQKASMERHQRQHTGERPYRCTMCHSSYTRKENLQTHFSRMHSRLSSGTVHVIPDVVNLE